MIGCVCLNAAIDVTYRVDALRPGTSHRVREVHARAGGKALNVARVLHQLDEPAVVLGFAGGAAGEALRDDLEAAGLRHALVTARAETRRTVTVVASDSTTVLNEPGGPIAPEEWDRLLDDFDRRCTDLDAVALCGSLPAGLPGSAYAQLIEIARAHDLPTVLDATDTPFLSGVRAGPTVVAPNQVEAATVLEMPIDTAAEAARAGRRLREYGADLAVITRGGRGAVLVTADATLSAHVEEAISGNPTGAGDALVAVLSLGLLPAARSWPDLLPQAISVAAAAVVCPVAGEFDPTVAARLQPTVRLEEV